MKTSHPRHRRRKLTPLRITSYAGIAVGAIVLVCMLVLLLFPGPLLNTYIKPRITQAYAEAFPGQSLQIASMTYSVFTNRFTFDSVTVRAADSTVTGTTGSLSVRGIRWIHLLWGGSLSLDDCAHAIVHAQDIVLNVPKERYQVQCGLLQVSVPDSEIGVNALSIHPSGDDEQFFAASRFRQTRFRLVVPEARVVGLACFDLLQGKMYHARYARFHDLFLDVLINKEKAFAADSSIPPMPSEILASIKGTLRVDSVRIMNGQVLYGERYVVGSKPALITFDSMNVMVEGIANHRNPGAPLRLHAHGIFMKAGMMDAHMSIPVPSPQFSYKFSGSMSGMDISAMNSFLEPAEQKRIKTGVLHEAAFDINVDSGVASGNVRAVYSDLTLAAINKQTGSEKGVSDGITTFIANTFALRGSNVPDGSVAMKIGKVKYTRQRGDLFLEFTWFALRSGLGDVVGF